MILSNSGSVVRYLTRLAFAECVVVEHVSTVVTVVNDDVIAVVIRQSGIRQSPVAATGAVSRQFRLR